MQDGDRKMWVDPECFVLAEHFLSDRPGATTAEKNSLAEAIQSAVEDCFFDWDFERESPDAR